MRYTRLVATGVMLLCVSVAGAQAQNASQNPIPAEFPPSSYTDAQYVDSRGCIFIRAGIDGNVTWVPRMTRNRQQVCGATPSLASAQPVEATPVPSDVEQITLEPASSTTPEPAPTAAVQPTAAPSSPTRAPSPRSVSGASRVSVPLIASPSQTDTRILPSHLVESRTELSRVVVPEGFEPVWTDGRLNPKRGEQSIEGYRQSQRTLTLQVPRQPVGGSGPRRIKEPRIISDKPIRTSRVQFVYGSRGTARKAELGRAVPSDQVFVQVAEHVDLDIARADARRMAQTGVPTRMGKKVHRGSAVQLVLAGPFSSRLDAENAVRAARRAGFPDAVIMN